jgi:hypothetical protein
MSRRDQRLEVEVGNFMKKYPRKKRLGRGPGDGLDDPNYGRPYNRSASRAIKRLDVREFDDILGVDEVDG